MFVCGADENRHLMTAINASGYGVIYLTPNQIFDFSNGGSVTFDISTARMSTRDWWDVTIQPYDGNLATHLISSLANGVDLNGAPRNAIHIATDNSQGSPDLKTIANGVLTDHPNVGSNPGSGIDGSVNQAATRQTFKLTIANGTIRFERLASATASALVYWTRTVTPSFTSGIVQFGHHSYNPTKDGAGVPATWHWDNLAVEPSTEFTMLKAEQRYTQGGTVTFQSPAPANAHLRFSAICRVSVNGVLVDRAPSALLGSATFHREHMSSYWVPIAEGATSVNLSFSADGWYSGPCIAKDFGVWSLETEEPTATPVPPTATPTATNTPVPPTATPTNTPVPTATPTATPIPDVCHEAYFLNGVLTQGPVRECPIG